MQINVEINNEKKLAICMRTPLSLAKALHRCILSNTSSFALQEVKIVQNTSVVQSGVLQHLVGMIPISVKESMLQRPVCCDCGSKYFCANCSLVFDLCIVNDTEELQLVTSSDLVLRSPILNGHFPHLLECQSLQKIINNGKSKNSNDKQVESLIQETQKEKEKKKEDEMECDMEYAEKMGVKIYPGITVVKLAPGHSLQLRAIGKKGTGPIHAKFAPVRAAGVATIEEIVIDEDLEKLLLPEIRKKIVDACPSGVFKIKKDEKTQVEQLVIDDINRKKTTDYTESQLVAEENNFQYLISTHDTAWQRLKVESIGTRLPIDILREAIMSLIEKLHHIVSHMQSLQNDVRQNPNHKFHMAI